MHPEAYLFAARVTRVLPVQGQHVLEIGSRDLNGSVRPLFASAASYTGIDVEAGPGVDVQADGTEFVPAEPPSVVVCMEVLEHTPAGQDLIEHAARQLRPDGWLLLTCATYPRAAHSGHDGGSVLGDGEYYGNVAPPELRDWLVGAGLEVVLEEVHVDRGDLYALARKRTA
jgi:SAM-dependent methyltransferase